MMKQKKEPTMFEREMMIAALRREQNELRELIEELEDRPKLEKDGLHYCGEVLKRIERKLKKLRRLPEKEGCKYLI